MPGQARPDIQPGKIDSLASEPGMTFNLEKSIPWQASPA